MSNSHTSEQGLIGSVLQNPVQFATLCDRVKPEHFDHHPFSDAWRAFAWLHGEGMQIDMLTFSDVLEREGKLTDFTTPDNSSSGYAAISQLVKDVHPEGAETYARQVLDYATKRRQSIVLQQAASMAANGKTAADVNDFIQAQFSAMQIPGKSEGFTTTLAQSMSAAYDHTDRASKGEVEFVTTGLENVDNMFGGGLFAPDLYIVAARPGQGKTSFLLTVAEAAAMKGKRVAFFSLEMGDEELAMRLVQMETGIPFKKQRRGNLSEEDWPLYTAAIDKYASIPGCLIINDMPAITISGMRRELNRMGDIDLIIVDYLQLADADGKHDNRVQEVTEISRGLKVLAKEYNAPVLAAAQLSRAVEQRADKRPVLSDLRESGSIEQDGNVIMLLYRQSDLVAGAGVLTELIIAKNRNGETGSLEIAFVPNKAKFSYHSTKRVVFENFERSQP